MKFFKPAWAIGQNVRYDRPDCLVEDLCKHMVGHPNKAFLRKSFTFKTPEDRHYAGIHGCDGCCSGRKP